MPCQTLQLRVIGVSRHAVLGICVLALFGCTRPLELPAPGTDRCVLSGSNARWLQSIVDAWARAARDFLEIDPEPLPTAILFDAACTWHLPAGTGEPGGSGTTAMAVRFEGRAVPVRGASHGGTVLLPSGARIPADIIAVAMPHPDRGDAFLVLAMPDLWLRHPEASRDPHILARIRSVALHEMLHTRQLPNLRRKVSALGSRFDLPAAFDDDVIEERFKGSAAYTRMFIAERSLLYEAVLEPGLDRKQALIAQALSIVRSRQRRFLCGENEPYAALEGLFLNMEGVAEWVRFMHHRADSAWPNEKADIIRFLRGRDNSWSQDEGLALILLLDDLVPDWKQKILSTGMPSPFDMLSGGAVPCYGAPR
jgi:hypothetical protein